jgi:hypothetical protein
MQQLRQMLWHPGYLLAFGILALAAIVGELAMGHSWPAFVLAPAVGFVQYRLTIIALGKR